MLTLCRVCLCFVSELNYQFNFLANSLVQRLDKESQAGFGEAGRKADLGTPSSWQIIFFRSTKVTPAAVGGVWLHV